MNRYQCANCSYVFDVLEDSGRPNCDKCGSNATDFIGIYNFLTK